MDGQRVAVREDTSSPRSVKRASKHVSFWYFENDPKAYRFIFMNKHKPFLYPAGRIISLFNFRILDMETIPHCHFDSDQWRDIASHRDGHIHIIKYMCKPMMSASIHDPNANLMAAASLPLILITPANTRFM